MSSQIPRAGASRRRARGCGSDDGSRTPDVSRTRSMHSLPDAPTSPNIRPSARTPRRSACGTCVSSGTRATARLRCVALTKQRERWTRRARRRTNSTSAARVPTSTRPTARQTARTYRRPRSRQTCFTTRRSRAICAASGRPPDARTTTRCAWPAQILTSSWRRRRGRGSPRCLTATPRAPRRAATSPAYPPRVSRQCTKTACTTICADATRARAASRRASSY
mmetsp:Transcript_26632/g.82879  ORF Transcript_26632/g.82879 Transcript_26632/m.82879 type:complete len:223 (+) Transcript_26632:3-671(+)